MTVSHEQKCTESAIANERQEPMRTPPAGNPRTILSFCDINLDSSLSCLVHVANKVKVETEYLFSFYHSFLNISMGNANYKPEPKWFPGFEQKLPDLNGKIIVITGCTSGTGLVVARTSVKKGAKAVLMLNRPSDRALKAEKDVREQLLRGSQTVVETIPCDLQHFESVIAAANYIKDKYEAIDVLCNNAGVFPHGDKATKDGYDFTMQTNHLSHFLLTKELFPLLKRAEKLRGEARIVNHSSGARRAGPLQPDYFGKRQENLGSDWKRYQQSKLANSVFTEVLKERLKDTGIKAVVAAPGCCATSIYDQTSWIMKWIIMRISQSMEDGAMPLLAACFGTSTENGDFWEPTHMGAMYGPASKVKHDKQTMNPENAKILWKASEDACGTFRFS